MWSVLECLYMLSVNSSCFKEFEIIFFGVDFGGDFLI